MKYFSEETRKKLSLAKLGKKLTEEHKANIAKGMKVYYSNESEEHRTHRRMALSEYQKEKSQIYKAYMNGFKPLMDGSEK